MLPEIEPTPNTAFWFGTESCAHEPEGMDAAKEARAEVPGALIVKDVGVEMIVGIDFLDLGVEAGNSPARKAVDLQSSGLLRSTSATIRSGDLSAAEAASTQAPGSV
jgi:hypothetical protein